MGQVRHGSATATHAVRAAPQRSQVEGPPTIGSRAGLRARAVEPGTGHQPKDSCELAQARDGRGHEDRPDGTALCGADQGRGGDGRRLPRPALLPLDDCLCALQPLIPHLPLLRAVLTVLAHRRPLAGRMPLASRNAARLPLPPSPLCCAHDPALPPSCSGYPAAACGLHAAA
jgi:hypothetical protein